MKKKENVIFTLAILVIGAGATSLFLKTRFEEKEKGNPIDFNSIIKTFTMKEVAILAAFSLAVISISKLLIQNIRKANKELNSQSNKYLRAKTKELRSLGKLDDDQRGALNYVTSECERIFNSELEQPPILHGSRAKNVASSKGSDIDLALVFKAGNVRDKTIEVIQKLETKFSKQGWKTRMQRHTLRVTVENSKGRETNFDILPAVQSSSNIKSGNVWIYDSVDDKRKKTNIIKRNKTFVNQQNARDTTILIKEINIKNDIGIPVALINQIVPSILKEKGTVSPQTNLLMSLYEISKKVKNVAVVDKFNSNNDLLSKLPNNEKRMTSNKINVILADLNENKITIQSLL